MCNDLKSLHFQTLTHQAFLYKATGNCCSLSFAGNRFINISYYIFGEMVVHIAFFIVLYKRPKLKGRGAEFTAK